MIIKREKYLNLLKEALEREKVIILTWARQVWKTTIILQFQKELTVKNLYVNLEDYFWIKFKSKQEFINWLKLNFNFDVYEDGVLFLDEVQYLEDPESILKSLYDDVNVKTKIIATWSRFWWIKRVGSSMVGRWEMIKVYPLSFSEFLFFKWKDISFLNQQNYTKNIYELIEEDLKEYFKFGWYPAVVLAASKEEKILQLKKIIDRFLEKDFLYFMKTEDLIDFKKFFLYVVSNIWNLFKAESVAQELWLNRYKVSKFLKFLEDSFLVYRVYPFFSDKTKEYSSRFEVFLNDLGFVNYFWWNVDIWKINENFVFNEILKVNKNYELYYWKNISWSEIDFVIQDLMGRLIPIEVKSNDKDNIPKIFKSFNEIYWEKISFFVRTTKSIFTKRYLWEKEVIFIPNFLIEKIL